MGCGNRPKKKDIKRKKKPGGFWGVVRGGGGGSDGLEKLMWRNRKKQRKKKKSIGRIAARMLLRLKKNGGAASSKDPTQRIAVWRWMGGSERSPALLLKRHTKLVDQISPTKTKSEEKNIGKRNRVIGSVPGYRGRREGNRNSKVPTTKGAERWSTNQKPSKMSPSESNVNGSLFRVTAVSPSQQKGKHIKKKTIGPRCGRILEEGNANQITKTKRTHE